MAKLKVLHIRSLKRGIDPSEQGHKTFYAYDKQSCSKVDADENN